MRTGWTLVLVLISGLCLGSTAHSAAKNSRHNYRAKTSNYRHLASVSDHALRQMSRESLSGGQGEAMLQSYMGTSPDFRSGRNLASESNQRFVHVEGICVDEYGNRTFSGSHAYENCLSVKNAGYSGPAQRQAGFGVTLSK